ncbi:MAG: adenylosuccinate synthase [Deltaproteobacteria bacterium]|nr:adenylosuccinate synthase [Deltaproteobacteria bacterium]
MPAVVVVGAQWGDEGKGKVVDLFSGFSDQVVRYSGGANAGHTMVVQGEKLIFHLIPCGALHPNIDCVLGQGMVVNPEVLIEEIDLLNQRGLFQPSRFLLSDRAHLVMPQHLLIDELRERGKGAIGTTKRGIGPTYEDKVARRGLRVGDLLSPARFRSKLEDNLEVLKPTIVALGGEIPDIAAVFESYMKFGERLKPIIGDASRRVYSALMNGSKVLMEGAQGTMLDIDGGTYPFVTSSSTVAGSACIGAGIGPTHISEVYGVSKAYTTRVGHGPFPSELKGELAEELRERGGEYGATTGRPRRCGWLDIPALRLAVRANGLTGIALTKVDVLTGQDRIQLCVEYELDGKKLEFPPFEDLDRVRAVYQTLPGWKEPLGDCRSIDDLPQNAKKYINVIEKAVQCPVTLLGVGPDREQTIVVRFPFK